MLFLCQIKSRKPKEIAEYSVFEYKYKQYFFAEIWNYFTGTFSRYTYKKSSFTVQLRKLSSKTLLFQYSPFHASVSWEIVF